MATIDVKVVNLNGKVVYNSNLEINSGVTIQLDLANLAAGMYFLQVYEEAKLLQTDKIVKVNK